MAKCWEKNHFFIVVQEEGNYFSHCVPHYTWLESLPHSSSKVLQHLSCPYWRGLNKLCELSDTEIITKPFSINFFLIKEIFSLFFSLSSANAVVSKSQVNQYWKYFWEELRNHTQALILMKNKNRTCQTKQFEI